MRDYKCGNCGFRKEIKKNKPRKCPQCGWMTIKALQKELDDYFSIFIRMRDSKDGIGICITCGRMKEWRYMDCGHYMKRQYLSTRYDEKNCNIQCKHCNGPLQGANEIYTTEIDKKWGPGTAKILEIKRYNKSRLTRFEYGALISHYQYEIDLMEGEM